MMENKVVSPTYELDSILLLDRALLLTQTEFRCSLRSSVVLGQLGLLIESAAQCASYHLKQKYHFNYHTFLLQVKEFSQSQTELLNEPEPLVAQSHLVFENGKVAEYRVGVGVAVNTDSFLPFYEGILQIGVVDFGDQWDASVLVPHFKENFKWLFRESTEN